MSITPAEREIEKATEAAWASSLDGLQSGQTRTVFIPYSFVEGTPLPRGVVTFTLPVEDPSP